MLKKFRLLFSVLFTGMLALTGCGKKDGGGNGGDPEDPPIVIEGESVMFHYQRKDNDYTGWDMWLWERGGEGAGYEFNGKDDFGVTLRVALSTWKDVKSKDLGFIIRKGGSSWSSKDCGGSDLYVNFAKFEKDADDIYHIYMVSGDSKIYSDANLTFLGSDESAEFFTSTHATIYVNKKPASAKFFANSREIQGKVSIYPVRIEFYFLDGESIDYEKNYKVIVTFESGETAQKEIGKSKLYSSEEFYNNYHYDGELGAIYSSTSTTFKVWSPFSKSLTLRIYDDGTPKNLGGSDEHVDYAMVKGEKGVYSYEVTGDLEGKYYTYLVTNGSYTDKEVVDPYAKSAGVNGLRGMIVDFSKTNPDGWDNVEVLPYDRKELTVYETHVADVTSSNTWTGTEANRKLFKGMYETGTTYTEGDVTVKTGFDHIKELGVNAVQIIPLFDQANDELKMSFNWGYNPLNYNVVEGGYSSNPKDGYVRIREFKELVKAYIDAGINIIMDVVYNHVNSVSGQNFDVLVPQYYFRYNGSDLSNGSGCGNETASEHSMVNKFIVDSVKFWASEYKLGGFRFDLMGLHDLDTMADIASECKKIDEHIAVYGEPWTGGTSTSTYNGAVQASGNNYKGYGAFNDQMRDALIKGGLSGANELGWITNNQKSVEYADLLKITDGIKGITSCGSKIEDPDKTVNYVTCHDNYTLYDRAIATGKYTAADDEVLEKMNALANSVVFTSQGTTFMLAGEEFLRTKQGNSNSYNASYEVNELDYSLKIKHLKLFESYQKLIALKQDVDGLHLGKDQIANLKVVASADGSMIAHEVTDSVNNRTYKIIHVNGLGNEEAVNLDGYTLYWSTIDGGTKALSSSTTLKPYETLIAYK